MTWLVPAEGRRVRFEGGGPMPPEGADVALTQYYRRRLRDGDLVEGKPPAPEPEKPAGGKKGSGQ